MCRCLDSWMKTYHNNIDSRLHWELFITAWNIHPHIVDLFMFNVQKSEYVIWIHWVDYIEVAFSSAQWILLGPLFSLSIPLLLLKFQCLPYHQEPAQHTTVIIDPYYQYISWYFKHVYCLNNSSSLYILETHHSHHFFSSYCIKTH